MQEDRIIYLELMEAIERAIQTLEDVQSCCKELYLKEIGEENNQNKGKQKKISKSSSVASFCNGENL